MHLFVIFTDDRQTTFLRRNLNDQITAAGAIPKNNVEYKADVDDLYLQLTKLLNERVSTFVFFTYHRFYCIQFELNLIRVFYSLTARAC